MTLTVAAVRKKLRTHAIPANVPILQRFFKTGPGQYGEGDRFIGVKVPSIRVVCREYRGLAIDAVRELLRSPVHEERALALFILVDAFRRADERERRTIYDFYLDHTEFINNWDLIDLSAAQIVGGWLRGKSKAPLTKLARSSSLWERRIAIVATFDSLRLGEVDETFRVADLLLRDSHDLIHKAVGWLLREAGKRDGAALRRFLLTRYTSMPRTMLRYAIEKFPDAERKKYLRGEIQSG